MGTDLCQYGNHKINFFNRNYEDIAKEIKIKLDNYQFTNEEYLKYLVIKQEEEYINSPYFKDKEYHYERLNRYKNQNKWEWKYFLIEEEDDENDAMEIEFHGFLDFILSFSYNSIYFSDPPFRYRNWFDVDERLRNEWREYMCQIIKLFGGDRVIYLPDQGADHYLDKFDQLPFITFEEIENELIKEYGKNDKKLGNITNEDDIWYYIDDFDGLDIINKLTFEEFKNWLEGKL